MGPRGVGVAYAMDDGQLAIIVEVPHGAHGGMQAVLAVNVEDLVVGDPHCGAVVPIQRVVVGDDGVEVVVTTRQLEHYQHGVFFACSHSLSLSLPFFTWMY